MIFARGLGWGAALGGAAGFVLPAATDLVNHGDAGEAMTTLPLGFFTAPIGLFFGAIAGLAVAGLCRPFTSFRHAGWIARSVAAVAGPVVVVGLSWALFRPSLVVGENQTRDHLHETVLLFLVLPGAAALTAGALFGHRLVDSSPEPLNRRSDTTC